MEQCEACEVTNISYYPSVSVMSPGVMVLPRPQGPAPGPRHRPLLPLQRDLGPRGGPVCASRQGHPAGGDNIQVIRR